MPELPENTPTLAHIPLDTEPETLQEVERSISGLGLQGIALEAESDRFNLGSEEIFPLYEKISLFDVPVVIHPSNLRLVFSPGPAIGRQVDLMQRAIHIEMQNCRACIEELAGTIDPAGFSRFAQNGHSYFRLRAG